MDSRGIKRKRYDVIKNDLSVELHKLTIDSGKYNTEVQSASEDFNQLLKALSDRQAELLTKGLLIQEQYSTTIDVLEKERNDIVGEGSGENVVLPATYAEDVNRLVVDSNVSLKSHVITVKKEFDDMQKILQKSEQILKQNMEELINRAANLEIERSKRSTALHNFGRYVPDDAEEEEED